MTGNHVYAGIDLGGTFLKFALIDRSGQIVRRGSVPTEAHEGHDAVLQRMTEGIKELLAAVPKPASVRSIGVGVPGLIDMDTGVTKDLANFPGRWREVPVAARLRRDLGAPAFLINDGGAFVVAEHAIGAARGTETAVCLMVGTGIGGGLVTNGRVLFGLGGAAGELGHVIVLADGPRCSCGNRGCVEALASGPSIAAEGMRRVVHGFTTDLTHRANGDLNAITPKLVAEVAAAGDEAAIDILERAGYYLGLAVASTIAALAPEVVVIGGGVAQAGGVYWRAIEQTARNHSNVTEIDRIAFKAAALGYDAGVIGATLWGMHQIGDHLSTPITTSTDTL